MGAARWEVPCRSLHSQLLIAQGCKMPLQKGQVVVLEARGARSFINGQQGVLLQRDGATGRYRARLLAEPWKVVKVSRSAIRPLYASEEVHEGPSLCNSGSGLSVVKGGSIKDTAGCFDAPLAKCDYCLGAYDKVQQHALPPHVKAVKSTWPLSPVKRGKMQDERPPPRIDQGELYRDLQNIAHHEPQDRRQVHRQRRFLFSNFKDAQLEHIIGLPTRRPPVQRGRPHKLLPKTDSEDLKALVEEDLQAEFHRKMEQARQVGSFLPKQESSHLLDHQREEEMEERLGRIQHRVEEARKAREEAKVAFEAFQRESGLYEEREATPGSEHRQIIHEEPPEEEESEEQRISREFKEYEMESLSHGPSVPSTPSKKDLHSRGSNTRSYDEGFEPDDDVRKESLTMTSSTQGFGPDEDVFEKDDPSEQARRETDEVTGQLKEGWSQHVDATTGNVFYHCVATNETTWVKPVMDTLPQQGSTEDPETTMTSKGNEMELLAVETEEQPPAPQELPARHPPVYDKSWDTLTMEEAEAAKTCGWTQVLWDDGSSWPPLYELDWQQVPEYQRNALRAL